MDDRGQHEEAGGGVDRARDRAWAVQLQQGDTHAWQEFEALVRESCRYVVEWQSWNLKPWEIDDILQDALRRLHAAVHRYDGTCALVRYAKIIITGACIDYLRKRNRYQNCFPVSLDHTSVRHNEELVDDRHPAEAIFQTERCKALFKLLDKVGEPCGSLLRLHYVEGVSEQRMADRHKVSYSAMCTKICRCLKKVRNMVASGTVSIDEDL